MNPYQNEITNDVLREKREKTYYEQYQQKNKVYEEKITKMLSEIGTIKRQLNSNDITTSRISNKNT